MKIKLLIIGMLTICCLRVSAQEDKNKLSIEFGYGINDYSMDKLNEFYIDSFAMKPHINLLQEKINSGNHFRFGVNYKPIALFDIGIYGSYQFGNSTSKPVFTETDDFGWPVKDHRGSFELRTEAIGIGLTTTWYVSHLLKLQEKENTLNRLHFGIEINGGIGFSKAIIDLRYPTLPIGSIYDFFYSRDIQSQAGLMAEYDFTQSPIFTTLGIRFGYQFYKTKTLKDRLDKEWIAYEQYPINLDFSGFYIGTYLKIGK